MTERLDQVLAGIERRFARRVLGEVDFGKKKTAFRVAGGAAAILMVVLGGFLVVKHLDGPRIVGSGAAPDGTEMCVAQICNWDGEPFTTRFYFRKPGEGWKAFYFDHQDSYWGRSECVIDADAGHAVFYRGGKMAITFSWRSETYLLQRWNRKDAEAELMPVGWEPGRDRP